DPGTAEQGGDLGWVDRSAFGGVLSEAVFNLSAGQVTEPIATQYGVHLVQVQDKRPAVTRSLEEVTPEIARSLYTQEEAKRLARAAADAALTTARAGTPLATQFPAPTGDDAALSGSSDPQVVETGSFSASAGAIPQLGSAPELSRAVFAREDAGLLDQTFQAGEAWVVAEVRTRTLPSSEAFASQEASLREEARRAKQYELRDAYVKQLREDARIVVNDQTVDAAVGGCGLSPTAPGVDLSPAPGAVVPRRAHLRDPGAGGRRDGATGRSARSLRLAARTGEGAGGGVRVATRPGSGRRHVGGHRHRDPGQTPGRRRGPGDADLPDGALASGAHRGLARRRCCVRGACVHPGLDATGGSRGAALVRADRRAGGQCRRLRHPVHRWPAGLPHRGELHQR